MVRIDAGVHATETVNEQAHIQFIHEMLTRNDPETLRFLNDDIGLFVLANPDGLELVANWYARADPQKGRWIIPLLYQNYVGYDDNRDSFAVTQAETTNINKASASGLVSTTQLQRVPDRADRRRRLHPAVPRSL